MDNSFEIAGRKFKLNKMDAFKQFHIARRMAPLLSELIPVFGTIAKAQKTGSTEAEKFDEIAKLLQPIMMGLSKLSDEDSNKVLFGLLSSVEMQQTANGGWAKLATESSLMFQDLDLPILLNAAGRAFIFNVGGFFAALPRNS